MAGTAHIIQSLVANSLIAVAKGIGAAVTGSGAMLAETLHTIADCMNQLLLLFGVKRSQKPANALHPLGYGRATYFWSFMVALLLFSGGGIFSIYEGLHKISHPEPVSMVGVGVLILLFALAVDAWATWSNLQEMHRRRGEVPFFKYLRTTKDSDLVVVLGENAAATLGLMIAIPALLLAWWTGDPKWDGIGTFAIGGVLIVVAIFLAMEVKSLLLGESADEKVQECVKTTIAEFPEITRLLHAISMQQGPGQVLLLLKLGFQENLQVNQLAQVINAFEDALRKRCPEVRWCFVEPDRPRMVNT